MTTTYTKLYRTLGVDIKASDNGQARGLCPFCLHSSHKFHFSPTTGSWDCKNCREAGNEYTLLRSLYSSAKPLTPSQSKELASLKTGIYPKEFKAAGIVQAPHEQALWIPLRSPTNDELYAVKRFQNNQLYNLPSPIKSGLSIWHRATDLSSHEIVITEGEWDAIALSSVARLGRRDNTTILSAPGARFPELWSKLPIFQDAHYITVAFDSDEAGRTESLKAAKRLAKHTKAEIFTLSWPSGTPDKHDIRDWLSTRRSAQDRKPRSLALWDELLEDNATPTSSSPQSSTLTSSPEQSSSLATPPLVKPAKKPKPPFKLSTLLNHWKRQFNFGPSELGSVPVALACLINAHATHDPLWTCMVGPSGAGKTLLLDAFRHTDQVIYRSSLKARSLLSGYQVREGEQDPSLLVRLPGKCLILKDLTEIFALSGEEQLQIFAILRGAYDGSVDASWGNAREVHIERIHFSMLAGVTNKIHRIQLGDVGERFLKYQFVDSDDHDPLTHIRSALSNQNIDTTKVYSRTHEYLDYLNQDFIYRGKLPTLPINYTTKVIPNLAQLTGQLRTVVEEDQIPDPEVGTRVARQLQMLFQCLCLVHQSRPTKQIFETVLKVAWDTARGNRLFAFHHIRTLGKSTVKQLMTQESARKYHLQESTLRRELDNLQRIRLVIQKKKVTSAKKPSFTYSLSPLATELLKGAKLPYKRR